MRKLINSSFIKISILLVLFIALFCCRAGDEKVMSWYGPGPIQVFGNKHEVWIFLEFERLIGWDRPACDAPRVYPVGHFQEIIIVNKQGLKKRIRIAKKDGKEGVTFNFMISRIFEHDGEIYLYKRLSRNYRESLFKFNEHDKRFDLLPVEEGDTIISTITSGSSWSDNGRAIYELSKTGSWRYYYSDRWIGDDSFTWQGIQFEISTFDDDPYFNIKIAINKPNKNYPVVLTYLQEVRTLTIEEYDNIKEESGHLNERGLESGLD
jgi:hypothetical protein